MGYQADDILQNLKLSEQEINDYDAVKGFHAIFFIGKKEDKIYEQAVLIEVNKDPISLWILF